MKEGELFSLLGPNGAGKTTTIRILTGLTRKTSGKVKIMGKDIGDKEVKKLVGYVPQVVNLDTDLSILENLTVHGLLYEMSYREAKKRALELIEFAGLWEKKDTPVRNLSGGQKRRALIVRALLHRPRVLFLDEPTVGLDPSIRRRIWALIKSVQKNGTTVFLTTHYIEEAEFLSNRVSFIDEGRIVRTGTPEELMEEIGEWAVDVFRDGDFSSHYFRTREEAKEFVVKTSGDLRIRRVNLEDAFIRYTGKKIE